MLCDDGVDGADGELGGVGDGADGFAVEVAGDDDAALVGIDDAGPVLNTWTQQVMRDPSDWSVGERELMAAMAARFNSSPFCVGAHSAVAVHGLGARVVEAAVSDYRSAPIFVVLEAALTFIEKMTHDPQALGVDDARAATMVGVSTNQLLDAAAVATIFNIVTRYANALDFEIPSPHDLAKSAKTLLKCAYK